MSDLFFSTIERLKPTLLQGDIDTCERAVASEIRKLALTPFHIVLDLSITNDPAEVASHFDRFFDVELKRFAIGVAYTEMNGFDINPGRWYCDLFGGWPAQVHLTMRVPCPAGRGPPLGMPMCPTSRPGATQIKHKLLSCQTTAITVKYNPIPFFS